MLKKCVLGLLAVLAFSIGFAESLGFNQPVSTQDYVGQQLPKAAATSAGHAAATSAAEVRKILKQSSAQTDKKVHQQMVQLTAMFLQQQKAQDKVIASLKSQLGKNSAQLLILQQKLQLNENQIKALVGILKAMNKQVAHVQHLAILSNRGIFHRWLAGWEHLLGPTWGKVASLIAIILIVLVLLWGFWGVRGRVQVAAERSNQDATEDDEDEYDFMGSEEGVAAKLDLARAYIAMDDTNAARTALNEVLRDGDEAQREQAQQMLNELKGSE